MAVGKWTRSAGVGALAAMLAVLALPANAQERGRWDRGRGGEASSHDNRGGSRGESRPSWRGSDNNRWNGTRPPASSRAEAPAAPAPPQAQGPRAGWAGDQWRDRNPGQVTPDRPSWRGRDDNDRWRGRAGSDRWGNDDTNRWRNDDNNRWRNDDNNRWRNDGNRWRGDNDRWQGNRQHQSRNWNRDWRSDTRYDWRGYRNANRNVYRLGTYYAPYRNYGYRRVIAGHRLDHGFFGSRYWINDPWHYRLPPVYGPYRWIRYFDDALLIDAVSGEVADVIYSFFW